MTSQRSTTSSARASSWTRCATAMRRSAPCTRGSDPKNQDMAWLRQLVDWQRETADPAEFLDSLRFEIGGDEVYVFTPKGMAMALPGGATPVDFASAVPTEVGPRPMGARVNGRLGPLDSPL